MNKSRKKTAVLFAYIFVILGIWMMLSVHCQAAETNNDEKQPQTIRVGSFEDTCGFMAKPFTLPCESAVTVSPFAGPLHCI